MVETPRGRPGTPETETGEEELRDRLSAVERALVDDDVSATDPGGRPVADGRVDDLAGRLDDVESRLAEVEAGVEAVRGYVGSLRAVNREVERRADAALAAADADEPAGTTAADVDLPADDAVTETGTAGLPDEADDGVRARLERLL